MRSIVMALFKNEDSMKAADRCIESGHKFGIKIEKMKACDPDEVDIYKIFAAHNLPTHNFDDMWSRKDKAMACFFSHYSAWALADVIKQPILVLEHDAVFTNSIDFNDLNFSHFLNIGKPSYGKYVEASKNGVQPFFHNPQGYLKGAHAYIVKPEAVREMIKQAEYKAGPADLFISRQNFKWMNELYPWPVEVKDTFSTVQKQKGAKAKHSFNPDYKII